MALKREQDGEDDTDYSEECAERAQDPVDGSNR